MDWQGEATAITQRRHGEHAVILTVFARDAGLLSGVVPGGASARRAALMQPGGRLSLHWRARRDDQLGTFTVEPLRARPGLMADADALAGLNAVTALIAYALPERDPHPRLADATEALLDAMDAGAPWADAYLRWEMLLLEELGFGLALDRCAVTDARTGLAYVSPRTGHAVTAAAAGAWAPRLLPLPGLLGGQGGGMAEALALTGHFLSARLAEGQAGRPLPAARGRLVARLAPASPRRSGAGEAPPETGGVPQGREPASGDTAAEDRGTTQGSKPGGQGGAPPDQGTARDGGKAARGREGADSSEAPAVPGSTDERGSAEGGPGPLPGRAP